MKKLFTALMISLSVAGAFTANAAETFYLIGENYGKWNFENATPLQYDKEKDVYTLDCKDGLTGVWKIATSGWVIAFGKGTDGIKINEAYTPSPDKAAGNLSTEFGYHCILSFKYVEGGNSTVLITDNIPPYIVGSLEGGSWLEAQFIMTRNGDTNVWTRTHKVVDADNGNGYFTFVSRQAGSWDDINKDHRYGAVNKDEEITSDDVSAGTAHDVNVRMVGESTDIGGANSWKIPAGTYHFALDLDKNKLNVYNAAEKPTVTLPEGYNDNTAANIDSYTNPETGDYFPITVTFNAGEVLHYSTTCWSTKINGTVIDDTTPHEATTAARTVNGDGAPLATAVTGTYEGSDNTVTFCVPSAGEIKFYTTRGTDTNISDTATLNVTGQASGVEDIAADAENGAVEYFNMQGMRVEKPVAGSLYIKRQGTKVTKVLVK